MKKILFGLGAVIVCGVAYYAISPLFNTVVVDDALPALREESPESEPDSTKAEVSTTFAVSKVAVQSVTPPQQTYPVIGTAGHPAGGTVRVIDTEEGNVLRYEDFSTINGPNLHVYLAKDKEAKEFIDLGPIKGTEGNINYLLPKEVSLIEYPFVLTWCVPFGVLFNYAELR